MNPPLHPQSAAALALWAAEPPDHTLDAAGIVDARARARAAAAADPREDVATVVDVDADGVPCRLYCPEDPRGVILYAHGGGFVFGDLETHDSQARRVANRTGHAVLSVDYRRPPEHPFPAAPDDVETALHWLLAHRDAPGPVVALGDSAGGNLVLVAALRNPGVLDALVVVYPFIDAGTSRPAYAARDSGLDRVDAQWYWQQYVADPALLTDPEVSPIGSSRLGTLPRTLVQAAECDSLLDENLELGRRIREAGGDAELTTYAGMVHSFWRQPALFDAAEESLQEIADFLR